MNILKKKMIDISKRLKDSSSIYQQHIRCKPIYKKKRNVKYDNKKTNNNVSTTLEYMKNPLLKSYPIISLRNNRGKYKENKKLSWRKFSRMYTINPFLCNVAAEISCDCNAVPLLSKEIHDIFKCGECLEVEDEKKKEEMEMETIQTNVDIELELTTQLVEEETDCFLQHILKLPDRVYTIFLHSNIITFICPICLERNNTKGCLIQQCGHVICKQCVKGMLTNITDKNLLKCMIFPCPKCRFDPSLDKGRGQLLM